MIIRDGKIFGEDAAFHRGSITVAGGKITQLRYASEAGQEETGMALGMEIPEVGQEKAGTAQDAEMPEAGQEAGTALGMEVPEAGDEEVIDASGCYVIPGMVDIHFHGCVGYDFCDGTKEAFEAIAAYQASNGITSIIPATMTLSREELAGIFEAAGRYCAGDASFSGEPVKPEDPEHSAGNPERVREGERTEAVYSTLQGINMEGPFVSLAKKGAQNGAYIHKPDIAFYRQMQQLSGGLIRQVAVAPEEDEDLAFIREVSRETVVSVAHTTADYETARRAFAAGASHVTHLFNAMPPMGHRDPGVVGAAHDCEKVFVELICDGIHIHPAMVRAAFGLFGPERICMISDSMMATGMPDGAYSLGGQAVTVRGKLATLADGTIAGSASNLHDCLKVAVKEMGIPLESAVLACTRTPARSLGLEKVCGSLSPGRSADLVLLDQELNVRMVIKDGRKVVTD